MDMNPMTSQKAVIGRDVFVALAGVAENVPAKVDTGADTSAIWASDIFVEKDGKLHFKLFGQGSPYYTGDEMVANNYSVAKVKSASGHVVLKYKATIPATIKGKQLSITFGLSNRSKLKYPILIGRETLIGNFIVDVEEKETTMKERLNKQPVINKEMQDDPYRFYMKQYLNGEDKK